MTLLGTGLYSGNINLLLQSRHDVMEQSFGAHVIKKLRARRLASRDLLAWGRYFFPHYFTLPPGRHHVEMAQKIPSWIHGKNKRIAVKAPRGNAKSTIVSFLIPMYCICHGVEKYIMLLADTAGQAVKHLKGIQHELENNTLLKDAYSLACGIGPEWNTDGILTNNKVRIEPLGTEQKIRGRRELAERPGLIIIDDPEGDEAATSSVIRESVRDWATKGVFKAGTTETNIIVSGTVVHRECLVNYCATQLPGWETYNYRSIEQWPNRMDMWGEWEQILRNSDNPTAMADAQAFYLQHKAEMDDGAKVLWPEHESLYQLMVIRAVENHNAFESEKQNNPVDPSKCDWGPEVFSGNIWFDQWPTEMEAKVMALDPSKGKSDKSGDYQAIVMAGYKDGIIYIDADGSRRPIPDMIETFVRLALVFRPDMAVCEADQFQELIVNEIAAMGVNSRIMVPIEGISTEGVNKLVRIRRLGPYLNMQRIRFKRNSPGVRLLLEQLQDFPNGEHDDLPDAAEMCLRTLSVVLDSLEEPALQLESAVPMP